MKETDVMFGDALLKVQVPPKDANGPLGYVLKAAGHRWALWTPKK